MPLTRTVLMILALLLAPGAPAGQSGPINVLVMHWYDRGYFANDAFDKTLQAALQATAPEGVEYYSEYLETNRFPGDHQAQLLSEYLRQKYAGKRLDVLIAGVSPTLDFLLKYRHELFPGVPLVFATERPVSEAVRSEAGATGFTFGNTYAKTLSLALKWHPGTKRLFVVSGTLNHDKALESIVRDDLRRYENTVSITYLTDLTPDELTARIRAIPKDSLILYVWQQALDAQGQLLEAHDLLARVSRDAKVPIYGRSSFMIGRGIVGGYVWTQEGVAAKLAETTMRVLSGARPKDMQVEKGPDTPIFDWRQLQRWGIDEDRLPPGSIIRFRELTIWQQYKWRMIGAVVVVVLQALLIGALLVQRKWAQGAQRVLQESEERFRNMADTAPTMIWVFDRDRRYTFFNRAWLTFTGRTIKQELVSRWLESVHPDDRDRVAQACSSAFDTLTPLNVEYRMRRADGEYRSLLCTGVPRFQKDSVFAGYIGSCVDISDLRRAQERALAGQKLELMGTLANGVAHDFNNLLGGILASAELALSELAENANCEEELLQIRTAAGLGAQIVREVMTFGGKDTPALGPVDCTRLIREISQVIKVSISKSVMLKTELADDLGTVLGNPAQLQQLIMNLVVNASQAIGDRKGEICIRATMLPPEQRTAYEYGTSLPDGDYVQLEVADTGPGMDDEIKARIFDPFFSTKPAGRGLGLAVVDGVVRAHGGIMKVVSAPGRGTTFRVLLPCLPKHEVSTDGREGENSGVSTAAEQQPTESRTVLIIEDEKILRESVAAMLRKRGVTVIEAEDGNAGVDLFIADRPKIDVVLLDMTLPGKTGRLILEELQRIDPEVKVIVTSAYGPKHVQNLLYGLRASAYLQKPYRFAQVETVLQKCFAETGTIGLVGG
jgi:PAS domain S-box-containing protein